MSLVSINGVISPPEEAKISVYDRSFLFGDAVYEVTRSYGKVFFALEKHIERLYKSALAVGIEIGFTEAEIMEQMYSLAGSWGKENVYIRIQVSRGNCAFQQISLKPSNSGPANIVMYLHDYKDWEQAYFDKGIHLSSSQVIRNPKSAMDPNIKSGNYLNNILSIVRANNNADDSFMLDDQAKVCEGSTFNLFAVRDGSIFSPPDEANILHGITRGIILQICKEESIPIVLKSFDLEFFTSADEAFCSSATKEVMPIRKIDDTEMNSPGPMTTRLTKLYKQKIVSYCESMKGQHPIEF